MHIKSITVQGFKSYRDIQTVEFSEKTNIVVGRNGAGKSNFFSAIRFVLSDAYTSLGRQERQTLLHEGSSTAATFSAYVEIVFDNSDGRFQTGKDEVILRRTVGAKKDDYSLDRKSTTKAEVMSILESAGFSRSNPFYIVPQGRVTALTNQRDNERLELLKEIAGTRVYEDRRAESVRIMEETDQKRLKIDELLEYIDERLNELEEEKKELKEFQAADRDRRCTEYSIYQHDLEEATSALAQIEEDRVNDHAIDNDRREEAQRRERNIQTLEDEIKELEGRRDFITLERQQHEADKSESYKAKTQIELLIRDLEEASVKERQDRQDLEADLEALQADITEKEEELEEVEPRYADTQRLENEAKTQLDQAEAKKQNLFNKQGRASQFRTQKERDTFLRAESEKLKAFLKNRETSLESLNTEIGKLKNGLERKRKREDEIQTDLGERKSEIAKLSEGLNKLRQQRSEVDEKRKEGWKDDEKLGSLVNNARNQLQDAEKTLYATMDRGTQEGLRAVEQIAARLGLDGVHGPLYSLFETDEMFRTAVEVTAGNSLFHVVVDTDETASAILDVMVKQRLGRVTFMPLNRLKPKAVQYPQNAEDAVPMLIKLRFEEAYRPAMAQVFSKTIMVPDLTVGGQYSRSHGLTSITLRGDKYDKKGSMTGGYHDTRRSRLEAIKSLKSVQARYEQDARRKLELTRSMRVIDQERTRLTGEEQNVQRRLDAARDARGPLAAELDSLNTEIEQFKNRLARLEGAQLTELTGEIEATKLSIEGLEDELQTKMADALSEQEVEQLNRLSIEIQEKKKELTKLTKDRSSLASRKATLEIELHQNLRRKRNALKSKLDGLAEGGAADEAGRGTQESAGVMGLESRRAELKRLETAIASLSSRVDAIDTELEEIQGSIAKKGRSIEGVQTQASEEARTQSRAQKHAERNLMKRQLLLTRREGLNGSIRELGVLPTEAYEMHEKHLPVDKLMKRLHKAKETLKKFTSVNKKAFDQYAEFTKQREDLVVRREELDESADSINELIDTLDSRKDEAIERTFKQVSRNFEEVFARLVPTGRGRLVMQSTLQDEEESGDEDEDGDGEDDEDEGEDEEDDEDEEGESDEEEDEEDEDMESGEDESEEEEKEAPGQRRGKKRPSKSSKSSSSKHSSKTPTSARAKPKPKPKSKSTSKTSSSKAKSSKSSSGKQKKQQKPKQKQKTKRQKEKQGKKTSKIDSYTGIAIKVSFNSKTDEGLRIQQLSGGQKSLVALAVIFAIQKCDPAPFYLFDEIDANLDADRRTAVAAMIHSLSSSAQFIITTFRPELLGSADNFLGVVFDNRKISSVRSITQQDAYEFVEAAEGRR